MTEPEQNRTEWIENGYGTDTERYPVGTERERGSVWNGYRTRSVKRSLLGFFFLPPKSYLNYPTKLASPNFPVVIMGMSWIKSSSNIFSKSGLGDEFVKT